MPITTSVLALPVADRRPTDPTRLTSAVGATLTGAGLAILAGWWVHRSEGTAPLGAVGLALAGAATVLLADRPPPHLRPARTVAATVAAAGTAALGVLGAAEDVAGRAIVHQPFGAGYQPPELAVGLLVAGIGIAVAAVRPVAVRAIVACGAALAVLVVVSIVELAASVPRLFGTAVPPVTAASAALLGLALLAVELLIADRAGGIHALWVQPGMKSALLRSFVLPLPVIAAGPIAAVSLWVDHRHLGDGRVVAGAGTATLAALMGVSALLGRHLGDRFAGPLEDMAVQARRIATGDLGTPLPPLPPGSAAEVEDLARSFEAMRVRLAQVARQRDEFVAMVAHDLRAPMTTIAGFAETLRLRGDALEGRQRDEFLLAISRSVGSLAGMVDDMLQAASLESGDRRLDLAPCDVTALVERVATEGEQTWGRPVRRELPPALPLVTADAQRVWQVLTNLVSNAAKYSPANEVIDVRATVDGDVVRIEVTDRGPGIDPTDQGRVWEKFTRVPSAAGGPRPRGTGLGLYICRELVTAQGGRVGVRSRPGQGSTFWFTLPVAACDGRLAV